ncbi:unnamed protein product [Urochloa decumbens]|uniref:F-box domain-containing protein n=1 Tax=Urochloa decumbens TaxID=240449 RepID=A0ABC9EUB4_9POAL
MAAGNACDFCREDQLEMECCRGGLLPRSAAAVLAGLLPLPDGEEDRISALPDDMLLQILARLGCARAAAHTGLLARRWRGLWARLPELTFHRIAPAPLDTALAMVARPAPSLLDIHFFNHHEFEPARVSSLLRAAAGNAVYRICGANSIAANGNGSLHLENGHIDGADMLPLCPRLRKLWALDWKSDSVVLHSEALEDLAVYATRQIRHIDIVAPAVKKLYLVAHYGVRKEFSLSFSAPAVEDLTWKCETKAISYRFGVIWRMWSLTFSTFLQPLGNNQLANNSEIMPSQAQHRRVGVLSLNLETNVYSGDAAMTFEQEIHRFQVTDFSILELDLTQRGHVYGAIVLHLIGLCTSIQKLKVTLDEYTMGDACFADCLCDQPNNWRSQSISLNDLNEVEIQCCRGQDHEVDLLKVLLRCATGLERVTLRFSRKHPPSDRGLAEIDGILKAYPYVKCNIYHYCGKQVLCA